MSLGFRKRLAAVAGAAGLLGGLLFMMGCVSALEKEKPADTASAAMEEQAVVVRGIDVFQKPEVTRVHITSNRKLTFTSVKQAFPLGIAVYFPEARVDEDLIPVQRFKTGMVQSVAAGYADQEKATAKVEVLLNRNVDYEVREDEDGLWLLITEPEDKAMAIPVVTALASTSETLPSKGPAPREEELDDRSSPVDESQPAVLTAIDFETTPAGESVLTIETSREVHYDLDRNTDGKLVLVLPDTILPEYRQRPLITTYFRSAIERIDPIQAKDGSTRIEVALRDVVPYRIVQESTALSLFVEASSIAPPALEHAEQKIISGPETSLASDGMSGEKTDAVPMETSQASSEEVLPADEKSESSGSQALGSVDETRYTGEKIRLDFFETDIKNVFRILRSVSGKNFAVDRDVTGNVTLTLDKPVPWDQVLDLVLKMNGLGKIHEGTIIRIATQETLKREDEIRQAAFAARQLALEQEKQLEPLETVYIPINYSDAEKDIRPHLEKILTVDRGQLSVDARTNMIILTDTVKKIEQAKEMIYRLDKVTPQIMIAARVVEVSEDFSKELGIDWSMSSEDVYRDDLGGEYGFDISMNYPVAATSAIGYTFDRITGTPFALNARLTASETKGDVKIISSPRILTLDNKKAKIKQGLEYAYLERDDAGGSSVKFKSIDLLLEVTPHVTPDDRIAMSLYITKNDIDSITDGVPSLSTNEAETELLVNDGNTIVIGGIVKNSLTEAKTGFPYLSDIPVLGYLFRSDSTKEKTNELLIFITPTIVQLEQRKN